MHIQLFPMSNAPDEDVVEVARDRFRIGRAIDCHHRMHSALVSRHHCELLIDDEHIWVHDLGSRNGTYVNNQRISNDVELEHGDLLSIATSMYRVEIEESEDPRSLLARLVGALRHDD